VTGPNTGIPDSVCTLTPQRSRLDGALPEPSHSGVNGLFHCRVTTGRVVLTVSDATIGYTCGDQIGMVDHQLRRRQAETYCVNSDEWAWNEEDL